MDVRASVIAEDVAEALSEDVRDAADFFELIADAWTEKGWAHLEAEFAGRKIDTAVRRDLRRLGELLVKAADSA